MALSRSAFLRLLLPANGFKQLWGSHPDGRKIVRWFSDSNQQADAAEQFNDKGWNVYHACASFATNANRTQENALAAKAFWLDVDVRADKGYASMGEAAQAVVALCKDLGLHLPMVVDSGGGMHLYWVLDAEIAAAQWIETATLFKRAVNANGMRADPTRTADISSVLRTIGTTNHKWGKPVRLVQPTTPLPYAQFHAAITAYLECNGVSTAVSVARSTSTGLNSDLAYTPEYQPSSAHIIADQCKQLGHIREQRGNVGYQLWWNGIGVLKHTVEGDALIHEWSAGHPQYSQAETQAKIEEWSHGPTTCQRFRDDNPSGCEGCPFKVTSPIQLGEVAPTPAAAAPQADLFGNPVEALPTVSDDTIPPLPDSPRFGERFFLTTKNLKHKVVEKTEDGKAAVTHYEVFCATPFWGISYYKTTAGYAVRFKARVEKNTPAKGAWVETAEFDITCASIAAGGSKVHEELGRHMVAARPAQKKAMEMYLHSWMEELKQQADEILRYAQYGWQADRSFLMGSKLYRPDGSVLDVVLSPETTGKYQNVYVSKGDLQEWSRTVAKVYNYPDQEQYQFIVAAGFGAPLMGMFPGDNNLIINMLSPVGGMGKTTNAKVALSIYGNPNMLNNNKGSSTPKAIKELTTIARHLPVMVDEITPTDAKAASALLYDFSSGAPAQALTQSGQLRRSDMQPWGTFMFTSSNKSLVDTLVTAQPGADAELLRMFEYYVRPVSQLEKQQADALFPLMFRDHYGLAGPVFLRYVVSHYDEVHKLVMAAQRDIDQRCSLTVRDRFLSTGLACVLAGGALAVKLGLVGFDIVKLRNWIVQQVGHLAGKVRSTVRTEIEAFGQMLNELSEGFLITDVMGDARSGSCSIEQRPRGAVIGRVIRFTNEAYLDTNAARKWCIENRIDFATMQSQLRKQGLISTTLVRISLLKGTGISGVPVSCWQLTQEAVMRSQSITDKVVLLNNAR